MNPTPNNPPEAPRQTHRDLLPRDACPQLMLKHVLTGDIDAPVYDSRAVPGDGHFWCLRTCEAVGPDDGLCDPSDCRPGRRCYEGLEL